MKSKGDPGAPKICLSSHGQSEPSSFDSRLRVVHKLQKNVYLRKNKGTEKKGLRVLKYTARSTYSVETNPENIHPWKGLTIFHPFAQKFTDLSSVGR